MIKSLACYTAWKDRFLCNLRILINKFSHIQIEEPDTTTSKEEKINSYKFRLESFPNFFEKLVIQIFR